MFGDTVPPFSLLESMTFAATPLGVGARGGHPAVSSYDDEHRFAMRLIALSPPVKQTRPEVLDV